MSLLPENGSIASGASSNFIHEAIVADLKEGKCTKVITRFPPEPNGHLHIGHAKALHIDYGMACEFGGQFNLRFDDTNPSKEEDEYVKAIIEDVKWLGCDFKNNLFYASDYFDRIYSWTLELVKASKAYVCDLSADEIRAYRGTLTEKGKDSPYRSRTVDENLDLFERMQAGEFAEGTRTLRAKIDMGSPNINMRDPVMYRIIKQPHHRQGTRWNVYPMYDWAHGLEDSIEGVTHSLCSLEYEDHRPLYDWFLDQLPIHHPRQIEFARLNLSYTVMSKRKLLELVQKKHVDGWDDPRLPTIAGLRRRGYTSAAIADFAERIGVAKRDSVVDVALLEHCIREDLNKRAKRVQVVLNPVKVIIDNYPQGVVEELTAVNNPENPADGTRQIPFSRELYIEHDDFRLDPPKKYYRLSIGKEVRLRYGYFITATSVVTDPATGAVLEIHATYDPQTKGGQAPDGRSPKATIHWVSAQHAISVPIRMYDRLFTQENPDATDYLSVLNPSSLSVTNTCKAEPRVAFARGGESFQFERVGYFFADPLESKEGAPIFNRTVTLKDSWARIEQRSAM